MEMDEFFGLVVSLQLHFQLHGHVMSFVIDCHLALVLGD